MPREWPEVWSNQTMAEEAARVAKAHLGTPAGRVSDAPPAEYPYILDSDQPGPWHYGSLRELYYLNYAALRHERRMQLEIPPGVPKEYI